MKNIWKVCNIHHIFCDKKALEKDKKNLKELLDEAGEDFLEKESELEKALGTVRDQEKQMVQQTVTLVELQSQLEESRYVKLSLKD